MNWWNDDIPTPPITKLSMLLSFSCNICILTTVSKDLFFFSFFIGKDLSANCGVCLSDFEVSHLEKYVMISHCNIVSQKI